MSFVERILDRPVPDDDDALWAVLIAGSKVQDSAELKLRHQQAVFRRYKIALKKLAAADGYNVEGLHRDFQIIARVLVDTFEL